MQYWYFLEVRGQPSASALTVSLVWGRLFCCALNVPGSLDCKPLGSLLFPLLIQGGCSGAQHFCGLPGFRLRCLCSKFFTHWSIFSAPRVFLSLKKQNFLFFYVWGCFARTPGYHICAMTHEARRGHHILWAWNYRGLWALWVVGNWTHAPWEINQCPWPLSQLSRPQFQALSFSKLIVSGVCGSNGKCSGRVTKPDRASFPK